MFQSIKEFLKKIIPPPMNVFMREIHSINSKLIALDHRISNLKHTLSEEETAHLLQLKDLRNQFDELNNELDKWTEIFNSQNDKYLDILTQQHHVEAIQKEVLKEIQDHRLESVNKRFYNDLVEREALVASFGEIMQKPVIFEEKFSKLIANMPRDSVDVIVQILWRMNQVLDGNSNTHDLFTSDEQEQLRKMEEDFKEKILPISNALYYYDGYFLPANQFDPSVFYSKYGLKYVTTISSVRNKDIIDVGGYVGDTALILSPLTDKKVYVFEASPDNYKTIQKTIEINHLENIVVENLALGDSKGIMTFSLGQRSSCNTLVERPGYVYPHHIDVSVETLDDYVQSNHLEVGLIKVDIEGGEQLFLSGAMETIKQHRPILLISAYHSGKDFFDIKPMLEELDLGYQFRMFKPVNALIAIETVLIAEVGKNP